jgi:DNA-directed RNA polymerase subunit omega
VTIQRPTLMDPPIEQLLDTVDSKFTLVALGAMRARQINSYYNSLGQGIGAIVPPQVTSVSNKSLSIAFQEIAEDRATFHRPTPEELAAELAEAEAPTGFDEELLLVDPFAVVTTETSDEETPDAG